MLDFMRDVEDYDALFFIPAEEDSQVYFQSKKYKDPGQLVDNNEMGPTWHVVLFRSDGPNIKDLDQFEGVLSDPREYISELIPSGWFGVVAKKTTTSSAFMKEVLDNFRQLM